MTDAKEVTMKNGRLAAKGICPNRGTGMFKFLPKKEWTCSGSEGVLKEIAWVSGMVGSYETAEAMLKRAGRLTISDSSVWRRAQEWGKEFKGEEDTRRERANALPNRNGVYRGVRETEE
jgi:hypothetical protein